MPAKAKKRDQEVTVGNRRLKLTNLDKVLYPKTKTTKAQVIDYYARVADVMLPHLKGRPLTLRRFPEGVGKPQTSFFEKNCPKHRPEWVKTTPIYVDRRAGEIDFCLCENRATLAWMAQLAALELHPSLSKATRMEQPTVLVFDLDPGAPAGLVECCQVALRIRKLFGAFGLEGFPKVSGGKGMQVYFPLNTKVTYEQTGPFAKAVAQLLEKQTPEGRRLEDGQGGPPRQGLRRLEPESPEEDDDRRVFAAGARAPHRLDPAPLATRWSASPGGATPRRSASRSPMRSSGSRRRAISSSRFSS